MSLRTIKRTIQFFQIKAFDNQEREIGLDKVFQHIQGLSKRFDPQNIQNTIYWQISSRPDRYLYLVMQDSLGFPISGKVILARKDEIPAEARIDASLAPIRLSPNAIGIGEQTHFVIFKENIHGKDIYIVGYEFNPFGVRIPKFAKYLEKKSSRIGISKVKYYVLWDREYVRRVLQQREIKSILLKVHVPKWLDSIHNINDFLSRESTTSIQGLYNSVKSLLDSLDDENMYTISINITAKRRKFLDKSKVGGIIDKIFELINRAFGGEVRIAPFKKINIINDLGQQIDILNPVLKVRIVDVPLEVPEGFNAPSRRFIDSIKFFERIKESYEEMVKPDIERIIRIIESIEGDSP